MGSSMYAQEVLEPHYRTSAGHTVPWRRCDGLRPITCAWADDPPVALRPTGSETQLGQLRPDDCPKYLAKCIRSALKEYPIHEQEGLNLERRPEGIKALLEVFDKVR